MQFSRARRAARCSSSNFAASTFSQSTACCSLAALSVFSLPLATFVSSPGKRLGSVAEESPLTLELSINLFMSEDTRSECGRCSASLIFPRRKAKRRVRSFSHCLRRQRKSSTFRLRTVNWVIIVRRFAVLPSVSTIRRYEQLVIQFCS